MALTVIQLLGRHHCSHADTRALVGGVLGRHKRAPKLLEALRGIGEGSGVVSVVDFDDHMAPSPFVAIPQMGPERLWPPPAGYTFTGWIYITEPGHKLKLFRIYPLEDLPHSTTEAYLQEGKIHLDTGPNRLASFAGTPIPTRTWLHIAVVHVAGRTHTSLGRPAKEASPHVCLYLNGNLAEKQPMPYLAPLPDGRERIGRIIHE